MPPLLSDVKFREIENSIRKNIVLLEKTERTASNIAWLRFSVFLGGVTIFFTLFFLSYKDFAAAAAVIFALIFIIVSVRQSLVLNLVKKYKLWLQIKKTHLARINLDWNNIPPVKDFRDEEISPFESDLDLTGEKSIHRLIDQSKSFEGSRYLKNLLVHHSLDKEKITERQAIIKELINISHFRERFLLESSLSSGKSLNAEGLLSWLNEHNKSELLKNRFAILFALCLLNMIFIALAVFNILNGVWPFTIFAYISVYLLSQKHVKNLAAESELLDAELKKIIRIMEFVENYNFGSRENLRKLCAPLQNQNVSPVRQMKKINSIINLLKFRNNPVVYGAVLLLFPIDYFLAYRLEEYKSGIAQRLPAWLEVKNKLEAYVSLAVFAYLNPDYVFPEISGADSTEKITLKAEKVGHPLIPMKQKVRNNFEIGGAGSISIITGSNMSGKSTFLRTLGVNICLAHAGAPVDAEVFSMSLMRLFTCIKVSDSVTDGISYFYAEVKRLKLLLEEINRNNPYPIIFMIDEIFKGTNNIERLKGSRALIKLLAGKNAAGLVSTHDLELVKLADEIKTVSNFHFREEISGGMMSFDYRLRTGPCPTTNALKIMSANGLPTE